MKCIYKNFQNINFQSVKKELVFWIGFGIFLFGIGKYLDTQIFKFIETHLRSPVLDQIILFSTEQLIYVTIAGFIGFTFFRIIKNPDHHSNLIPGLFSLITTGILAYILKSAFHIPRPFKAEHFEVLGTLNPLLEISSYSFPSAHAAISFSLLIPFWRISKTLGSLWAIFALFIGFSRVYENVHFPSDIAGGIFLGGVIGAFFSHPEIRKFLKILWEELEFRRQTFHFFTGFCCVFAHWTGILRLREIAFLLIIGLSISLYSQKKKIPFISKILEQFDRTRDKDFPGRGAFYFLLSVFLCIALFPVKIAYAAILILSVGDSFNHLYANCLQNKGYHFPWNKRKNLTGVVIGILLGTFAAQFFVPIIPAFIASSAAIFAETFHIKIKNFYIDDNIFVPLIAGGVLILLI